MNQPTSRGQKALDAYHREAQAELVDDRTLATQLWPFVRPHGTWLWISLVSIVLCTGLALVRPLIMLHAIDRGLAARDPQVFFEGGLLFALVAALEQVLQFGQTYAMQVLGARSMSDLRRHVFGFVGGLPLSYFDRQPVGRLVTRVTNDVDAIQELFSSGALSALGDMIRLVGVIVLMLRLDVQLSLVAFAAMPVVGLFMLWVRRRAREAFRSIRSETARMNANMNEQVNGVALIQAFGQEEAKALEFDGINAAYRDANLRSIKYDAIQDAAIDAISAISLASIVVALGWHGASFGTVVALTAYLGQFFEPISMLAQRYTLLQSAMSGAERVFGLLAVPERDAPPRDPSEASHGSSELELELDHVFFGYKPDFDVLHDIQLQVRPGERIALVGPTGSGKTTITALLLRLYEVRQGAVRIRGRDAISLGRDELRRSFAVVPQDVQLFSGTLAQNVAAGEAPDLERVRRVLEQMQILDVFIGRQGGLEAKVQPGGSNFSSGERQLIAFARALYRDAPILILDEATASVDSETEARMQRALEALLRGRTAIIVAHRLSTIRSVDRIVVLQKGHIIEQGAHEELMAHGGLYAALYQLQLARHAGAEEAPAAPRVGVAQA
ncbi:MAG TPA: ABC transporter ATP-binding protein [Polyangiaceae bacterium]|nr:ABC transporter ATP-binding protein [Polyangiaceae bacterium]